MRTRILTITKPINSERKNKMYEETLNDVQNIIGLKTVSDEAKARMIVELIMSHEEPRTKTKKESDFVILPEEPKTNKRGPYKFKGAKKNKTWTDKEDLLLYQRYNEELGRTRTKTALYKKLSKEFGRTPIAIEIRLTKKGWKNTTTTSTDQPMLKRSYKKTRVKIPVTQTEIDTVHRERRMGTPLKQIAKILNATYKRVQNIDYKLRQGIYKTSKQQNQEEGVEVGQSTKMPKKFSYMN